MSKLHVSQIQKVFKDLYEDKIIVNINKSEGENLFYTQCLSAYTVKMLSNVPVEDSITAITDGYGDNGIDFIHIDKESKQLIIGQSKWTYEGQKSPALGDILKLIKGFNDLVDCNFSMFNQKIKHLETEIENLLSDTECRLLLVITYSGSQPVSKEILDSLNSLKQQYNDISEILEFKIIDLKKIYQSVSYVGQGLPINTSITINNYGKIDDPYKALYGKVDAIELYSWYEEFGEYLFEKNLRKFISDSNINELVQKTLVDTPEKFWYFNNGITVLCNKIQLAAKGANFKNTGKFTLEGVNIVNGAQTVGNIYKSKIAGSDLTKASVMIKIISLEECEDDTFANEITKSTNSQNRILSKDFVTLDTIHERIFKELRLLNVKYLYKTGDKLGNDEKGISFEEAMVSLACSNENIRYAMLAKTSIGRLWEGVNKPPYTIMFNSKTTGLRVLRSAQMLFLIQEELDKLGWYGKLQVHSNRFMQHLVFCYLPTNKFDDPDFDFKQYEDSVKNKFSVFFQLVKKQMDTLYPNAHTYHFFRNSHKCTQLKNAVFEKISNPF